MQRLVILCGDRDSAVRKVMLRALKTARRANDTLDPEIVMYNDPAVLVADATTRKLNKDFVVVTTSYLYDQTQHTGELVVCSCLQLGIPVVLVSGALDDPHSSFEKTRNLAPFYLPKPFAPKELVAVVLRAAQQNALAVEA